MYNQKNEAIMYIDNDDFSVWMQKLYAKLEELCKDVRVLRNADRVLPEDDNLLEGYGNDNPGAKSQGMKQLMAGAGVAVVGMVLVPLLSGLFSV